LREVATNLIFNAVDAMPGGGTITIRSGSEAGQAVIEFIDTGSGMTEEVRSRCVEPFFSTKGEKGTGLGLSMVFGIIKRHEGHVEIESTPGVGTTFRIRLPGLSELTNSDVLAAGNFEGSLSVLVADDEPVTRMVVANYLKADGHRVAAAIDAEKAIAIFSDGQFDLLITDHAMPGMNGVHLAAALREWQPALPVILLTGFAEGSMGPDEEACEEHLIIRKPVSRNELRRAVATVMSGATLDSAPAASCAATPG
jgi:CheY-like chemotaxis protein